VSKPEQVSRPAKPALPAAGETSAAAAGAAEQLGRVTGCRPGYKIPRLVSPIREGYLENFQVLPEILDSCIIRAPERTQDKFIFSVLMEAGMVLSGREARDYSGAHFRGRLRGDHTVIKDNKFKIAKLIQPILILISNF
jgi:hypothetical protein